MTRLKNQFFAALGLAVLTGLFILAGVGGSNAAPPSPTPQDVKVVNTGANPVPTQAQGTTNIAGVVQAQQASDWTVGITGTPTVQVANSQADPVPVRDTVQSARQPVMISLGDALTPFVNSGAYSDEYVLASGKRLVIEQAYLLIQTVAGSQTIAYIRVYNQGPAGTPNRSFPILLTKQGTSGNFDGYVASGPTKLYVTGPVFLRFELFDRDYTDEKR